MKQVRIKKVVIAEELCYGLQRQLQDTRHYTKGKTGGDPKLIERRL
jgi:hypothetical protein